MTRLHLFLTLCRTHYLKVNDQTPLFLTPCRTHYLQVNDQTPDIDEALLQKADDLRTLQRRVAESPR